ncbi:MAG: bifunctional riboflavin kinase/FAD synthetase [Deltaproteobacteria bacterium]
MNVVNGSSGFSPPTAVSVTIGNFDGVHLGHRELLRRTAARAKATGTASVALTFSPHPIRFFSPQARFYEITSLEEKSSLIAAFGIDTLVVESFTGEVGRMWPEEFAREVLARRLRTRYAIVGYDFTFGRNRSGSPAMLGEIGRELGFEVEIVPPLVRGGLIVSSTRIRELLLAGRVREAEELLCRPYRVTGTVITGAGRGRKLGYPTANIQYSQELLPLPGVYVVEMEATGGRHRGVANVGFNPTFGENSLSVEVYVLDFDRDLYGQEISVYFRDRIRDERKYKSAEELVRQIEKDVQYARGMKLAARKEAGGREQDPASAGWSAG